MEYPNLCFCNLFFLNGFFPAVTRIAYIAFFCSSNFALVVAFPIGFHTRSVKRDQGRHNFRFFSITVVIGQIFSSAYCRRCWKMKCGDD
ncbi:hypothetical protein T06_13642 [Trichinella sp. T6]|nr:hypothetical protein T06_13642 [Trichinella sp. T6]